MKVFELGAVARFASDKMQKVALLESRYLFFDLYCLEPGQAQKPHRHEGADKVYVVYEGVARFDIGGETLDVHEGSGVVCPAGSDHGVSNPGPGRARLLVAMAPRPGVTSGG
jgi:mannose-6-phosphate isomerase-like protein (cupin superfamily)